MYEFNAERVHDDCVQWVRKWFRENGRDCNAVIGMSGGKDSTIAAAICAEAIGEHRVIGVAIPDSGQGDNEAKEICEYLGIKYYSYSIKNVTSAIEREFLISTAEDNVKFSNQSAQNVPPRVRMTVLFAFAQSMNGRVVNTCNLSENYLGYCTLFGDDAGTFSPLGLLTVTELLEIGDYMGLPRKWVHKIPDDGLPHSCSDEEKFGFTYAALDKYLRTGECDAETKEKIKAMHEKNKFKESMINLSTFEPKIYFTEKFLNE